MVFRITLVTSLVSFQFNVSIPTFDWLSLNILSRWHGVLARFSGMFSRVMRMTTPRGGGGGGGGVTHYIKHSTHLPLE